MDGTMKTHKTRALSNKASVLTICAACCLLLSVTASATTKTVDKCPPNGASVKKQSDKWVIYSKGSDIFACRLDKTLQEPYELLPGIDGELKDYFLEGDWFGATIARRVEGTDPNPGESDAPDDSEYDDTFFVSNLEERTIDLQRKVDAQGEGTGIKATQMASDGTAAWIEQKNGDNSSSKVERSLVAFDGSRIKHVVAYGDLDNKLELNGRTLTYYENSGAIKTIKTYELQPLTSSRASMECPPADVATVAESKRLIVYEQIVYDIESSFGNSETHPETRACTKGVIQKSLLLNSMSTKNGFYGYYLNGKYLAYSFGQITVVKFSSYTPLVGKEKGGYGEKVTLGSNGRSVVVTKDGALAWTEKSYMNSKSRVVLRVIDGRYKRHTIARSSSIKRELKLNGQKLTYFKSVNGRKKAFLYKMRKLKSKKKK